MGHGRQDDGRMIPCWWVKHLESLPKFLCRGHRWKMPLLEFVVNLKILQLESPLRGGLWNLDCEIFQLSPAAAQSSLEGICFPFCTTRQLKQARSWACRELNLSAAIFNLLLVYEPLQPGLDNVPLKVLTVETKDFWMLRSWEIWAQRLFGNDQI